VRTLASLTLVLVSSCAPSSAPPWRDELAAWQHPAPLPSFPLVDDGGRAFHLADLKGTPLVVAFVFSRCPMADACPLTMARLRELQRMAPSLQILIVTLDPDFDTPAVLAAYGRKHGMQLGGGLRLATGSKEVVDAMASLFNVIALRRGQGEIGHPVKLALLDKNLRPVHEWLDNRFHPREIFDASAAQ
jgi:protein SCO1/2